MPNFRLEKPGMKQTCHLAAINLSDSTKLDSLVEHRRVFNLKYCELNIFETFQRSNDVSLSYNGLVVSSMMRGKKIMTLEDNVHFDFLPGESVILPDGVSMKVNFPEADEKHPVQCATLSLDWDRVYKNLAFLNEHYTNEQEPFEWKLNFDQYHFQNNRELAGSINKLISISMEDDMAKDALADLGLKMLLLRIIQTQNLALIKAKPSLHHKFASVLHYIGTHLSQKISIDDLAKEACMSRSLFFLAFKNEFGMAPMEYVQKERIAYAKTVMADGTLSITDICYRSGFNNLNYFIKLFKRAEGITPSAYRK